MIVYGPLERHSCTEPIGEHVCVVIDINTEHASVMSTVPGPRLPAKHPYAHLVTARKNPEVLDGARATALISRRLSQRHTV